MTLSYFDSSILLAMLLDEKRQKEAQKYWENGIRVSSILLRIETIITLRRTYEHNRQELEKNWLQKKITMMNEYLDKVNYKIINSKVEKEIYTRKDLARCRLFDAIHIATALQFREINDNEDMHFYTFDKTTHELAKHYKFKTNKLVI